MVDDDGQNVQNQRDCQFFRLETIPRFIKANFVLWQTKGSATRDRRDNYLLGRQERLGRLLPWNRVCWSRERTPAIGQIGRLVSAPDCFTETNKQQEKTNKQNPERKDVRMNFH